MSERFEPQLKPDHRFLSLLGKDGPLAKVFGPAVRILTLVARRFP